MVVHDSHCHFLSARFFEALGREKYGPDAASVVERVSGELGWEVPGSPRQLAARWRAELDRHAVSRSAMIASVPGDEESVAEAVADQPSRFVGYFVVNPTRPGAGEHLARAFGPLGLRCACLFPALHGYRLDGPEVNAVFELAAAHGGAVFAHCGYFSMEARTKLGVRNVVDLRLGDPLTLASTASRFPTVPVLVPHFGGGFFREALMAAEACPNIHFDTSSSNSWIRFTPGLTLTEVFRSALAIVGPQRVLFGSDSSFFPRGWRKVIQGAQQAILDDLGTEPDGLDAIFRGNFERLFPPAR
jgi:uncharacterized protein